MYEYPFLGRDTYQEHMYTLVPQVKTGIFLDNIVILILTTEVNCNGWVPCMVLEHNDMQIWLLHPTKPLLQQMASYCVLRILLYILLAQVDTWYFFAHPPSPKLFFTICFLFHFYFFTVIFSLFQNCFTCQVLQGRLLKHGKLIFFDISLLLVLKQ